MELMQRVNRLIEQNIKPVIVSHGGDIEAVGIDNGTLKVRLSGQCSGCPYAMDETKGLILQEIRKQIPKIKDVEIELSVNPELLDFARKLLGYK